MAGQRRLPHTPVIQSISVVDPELDMRRSTETAPAGTLARLRENLRKLVGDGRRMRSPMRSIARELEESWPVGEA
jgi:hypothetical protein